MLHLVYLLFTNTGTPIVQIEEFSVIEQCKARQSELIHQPNSLILGYVKSGVLYIPSLVEQVFLADSYKNAVNRILSEKDIDIAVGRWEFDKLA